MHGAHQQGRELVADRQDELQVRDGLLGLPPVRWQPGQGHPAEELRQAEIGGRRLVQLGQRGIGVLAEARLEEPGEC